MRHPLCKVSASCDTNCDTGGIAGLIIFIENARAEPRQFSVIDYLDFIVGVTEQCVQWPDMSKAADNEKILGSAPVRRNSCEHEFLALTIPAILCILTVFSVDIIAWNSHAIQIFK
jgi:hypothetical protein